MDKLSIKILKHLNEQKESLHRDKIIEQFGPGAFKSLDNLQKTGHIKQGSKYGGISSDPATGRARTVNVPDGQFEIDSPGLDFLQHRFWNCFDKWITRITAIIGFITGLFSLILHFAS